MVLVPSLMISDVNMTSLLLLKFILNVVAILLGLSDLSIFNVALRESGFY